MKKKLSIAVLVLTILALWVTPTFAAQGQITEVNPSGTNTVVILQADDGEEEGFRPGDPGETHRNASEAGDNGTENHFTSKCLLVGC